MGVSRGGISRSKRYDQGLHHFESHPRRWGFVQIPGYEIEREIGRGGMATVYRAMQQSLGRQVAIKVLARRPDDQDEFAQRFKKEGRILAQLLHPNIVTIYDIGVSEDDQLFLSMEYLSDGTLRDRIKLGLSFDCAIQIVRSIAKALGYAHEKGVIHRDVKPSNIMFRHDGTPMLTDFGVARMVIGSSTVHTMTGLMVGSPGYMSPEQGMGQNATIQSDLYGLGVVLYEMLTGHPPYQADNPLTVMLKHLHDPIPKLPKEHANLQPILNKLLAKKPTDRYQDAGDFLRALNLIIPSDTGSQPKAITDSHYLGLVEFTSGTIRKLLQKRPRWSLWIWVMGAAILLVVVVYAFRSRNSGESLETLPEPSKPVANAVPVSRETEIATLLQQAEARLKAGLLTDEAEQNAEAAYRRVLKLEPGNAQALAGLEAIAREYERLARQRLEAGAPQESLDQIKKGLAVAPGREGLVRLRQVAEQQIAERKTQIAERQRQQELQLQTEQFLTQARSSFAEGLLEISLAHIEQGLLAVPDHPELLTLREQVNARMAERQRREEARRRQEEEVQRQAEEANQYLAQAMESQRNGGYAASLQQIEKGLAVVPNHEGLLRLREEVRSQLADEQQRQSEQAKREQEIAALLKQAEARMQAKRWPEPAGNNAEATYRQVLKLDAGNVQAQAGLARIAQVYEQQARQRRETGALQDSLGLIDQGLAVVPKHEGLLRFREEVARGIAETKARQEREEEQRLHAELFFAQARSSFQQGAWGASLTQIEQGLAVMSGHPGLLSLREQVKVRMAEQARQEVEAARRQAEEAERQQARQSEQAKREQEITALLKQADTQMQAKRLIEPPGNNAEATYRQVLKLDAGNAQAQAGLERIAQDYLQQARQRQSTGALQESLRQIDKGLAVVPNQAELLRLREEVRAQLAADQQKLKQQRLEQQQQEQQWQEEKPQREQQRKEQQRLEQQRQEEKQREQKRKLEQQQWQEEKQQQEQQRKLEQQRLEQQRLEQQRKEQQRLEQQRQEEKQRQEQQRKLEQQLQENLPQNPQPKTPTKPPPFGTF